MESVLQKAPMPGFANEFDNKAMSHVDGGMQHMMFPESRQADTPDSQCSHPYASANHSQCQ